MLPKDEVVRRYLVINTFESVLLVFAIILSFHFAGIREIASLLATCLSALLSGALAGSVIVLFVERAERKRVLKEYENAMLRKLDHTWLEDVEKRAILHSCMAEGIAPLLVGLACIAPFLFSLLGILEYQYAFNVSVSLISAVLFTLGIQLGRVIKQSKIGYGLVLLVIGLAVGFLTYLLTTFLCG